MDFVIGILNVLIVLGSLFLICIILIQRGKGGGLAGAFGGVGGSSAFGTKAGDIFTKITIGVAIGWMVTAMLLVILSNRRAASASSGWGNEATSVSKDLSPSSSKSKSKSPATGTSGGTDGGESAAPALVAGDRHGPGCALAASAGRHPGDPRSAGQDAGSGHRRPRRRPSTAPAPPSSPTPAKTAPSPK